MTHRYTEQQVQDIVNRSISYRQVLNELGIVAAGGNYEVLKKFIKKHNIDISHFKGQGWNRDKRPGSKVPIDVYLSNQKSITSHKLRRRLLKEKIFPHKCSSCELSKWLDNPIPLELDHINGNHQDNSLSNLRLLCPNCHSLTPTFRRSKASLRI